MFYFRHHRILIIVILVFSQSCAFTITMYKNTNFMGKNLRLFVRDVKEIKCHDLPQQWMKTVSSLQLTYACVNMYSDKNCTGEKRIQISTERTDIYNYHDLEQWDFDKSLVSFKTCNETEEKESTIMLLQDQENYIKETGIYLNILTCTNIPYNWIGRITRVKIFNSCFRYYFQDDCIGDYNQSIVYGKLPYQQPKRIQFPLNTMSISVCNYDGTTNPPVRNRFSDKGGLGVRVANNSTSTLKPGSLGAVNNQRGDDKSSGGMGRESIVIVVVSLFAAVLLLMILYGVYKYKTAQKQYYERVVELELQNEKFIEDFMKGNPKALEMVSYDKADGVFRAQSAPYDFEAFEIPFNSLKIADGKPLGAGESGMVVKARLNSLKFPDILDVAVKTVKVGADSGYAKALLDECKIMMYLNATSKHPHIVNLIGACTENISKLEPYIILEYCSKGSLHKFLRKKRRTFVNLVQNGQLIYPRNGLEDIQDTDTINSIHLMKWARDIADGMDFLAAKKVIHGDLAVRNILLDQNYSVKISDFGLSRQLYQYSLYVKKSQIPLPWRWMAIESLRDMTFSSQSDVWSFGVTLWEIFSLAETPYPGIAWNTLFIKSLKDGFRMSQPIYAPFNVYEWMTSCWKENPKERPNFLELKSEFSAGLPF